MRLAYGNRWHFNRARFYAHPYEMRTRTGATTDLISDPASNRANVPLCSTSGAAPCFGGDITVTRAKTRARSSLRPPSAYAVRTGIALPISNLVARKMTDYTFRLYCSREYAERRGLPGGVPEGMEHAHVCLEPRRHEAREPHSFFGPRLEGGDEPAGGTHVADPVDAFLEPLEHAWSVARPDPRGSAECVQCLTSGPVAALDPSVQIAMGSACRRRHDLQPCCPGLAYSTT